MFFVQTQTQHLDILLFNGLAHSSQLRLTDCCFCLCHHCFIFRFFVRRLHKSLYLRKILYMFCSRKAFISLSLSSVLLFRNFSAFLATK